MCWRSSKHATARARKLVALLAVTAELREVSVVSTLVTRIAVGRYVSRALIEEVFRNHEASLLLVLVTIACIDSVNLIVKELLKAFHNGLAVVLH